MKEDSASVLPVPTRPGIALRVVDHGAQAVEGLVGAATSTIVLRVSIATGVKSRIGSKGIEGRW